LHLMIANALTRARQEQAETDAQIAEAFGRGQYGDQADIAAAIRRR